MQETAWGMGNTMRSFAGALSYAMWSGRQLLMNYPLLERNFKSPMERAWFPPGDIERSKVWNSTIYGAWVQQKIGAPVSPTVSGHIAGHADVMEIQDAELYQDHEPVAKYAVFGADPMNWGWKSATKIAGCMGDVFGEAALDTDSTLSARIYGGFLRHLFSDLAPSARRNLAALRVQNGLPADPTSNLLQPAGYQLVAVHNRVRAGLDATSDMLSCAHHAVAAQIHDTSVQQNNAHGVARASADTGTSAVSTNTLDKGGDSKLVIFLATDSPDMPVTQGGSSRLVHGDGSSSTGNVTTLSEEFRSRFRAFGTVAIQKNTTVSHTKQVCEDGEFDSGHLADPLAADRAVLEWYVLSTATAVVKTKSSFSCTAALSGLASGRTTVVWTATRGCSDGTSNPTTEHCSA
jgi:hypothetical protein